MTFRTSGGKAEFSSFPGDAIFLRRNHSFLRSEIRSGGKTAMQ
jgi:hypothetical protein